MKFFVSLTLLFVHASAFAAKSASSLSQFNHPKITALRSTTVTAAAEPASAVPGGDASMASTTFNIAKSIVGAGVLSLPSGVAFFADKPSALIPASIICATMGIVAAYSYSLIGKACEQHNSKSFQEVWEKSADPKTAWMISAGITAQCFLASLAYSIIIGDSFTSIAASFNLPAILAQRNNIILAFTTFVLFPLCSLKSLNALAPFSLLGLGGTLYTAVFMAIRYFDKTYLPGGVFVKSLATAMQPKFNVRAGGSSVNHLTFVLLSMLSTSFIAHFNAPTFYNELKNTSMPRFSKAVNIAFGFSIFIYIFMMSMGFLTFGGACSGFVLNNYASADKLASLARLAVGMTLVTGYPFTFTALREGIMDLGKWSNEKRSKLRLPLTGGLLGIITVLAMLLKDVGFVVSISGAMFGSVIMFIVPAIMNLNNSKKPILNKKGVSLGRIGPLETLFNQGMIVSGVLMAVLGIIISTLRQFGGL